MFSKHEVGTKLAEKGEKVVTHKLKFLSQGIF